jgi:hypothetical protein
MTSIDYWKQCISCAAEECGLEITQEQLDSIAECVEGGAKIPADGNGEWISKWADENGFTITHP